MMTRTFACPRTCPLYEAQDICRFTLLFGALGTQVVNSHTTRVQVEIRDREALGRAAIAIGGRVLGEGLHCLYAESVQGYAIELPGWRYPIVLTEPGKLAYDNYNGSWGSALDLDRLTARYTIEAARTAAEAQGWICEAQGDRLVIYHPDGGTLTVHADGTCDAVGFCGADCHVTEPIEAALGRPIEVARKAEYYAERAHVREVTDS